MPTRRSRTSLPKLKTEFSCKHLGFTEEKPERFATTEWATSQQPYVAFRSICTIYATSMLIWKIYSTSVTLENDKFNQWLMEFPTWMFMILTLQQNISLLLAIINFMPDCLCNDDFVWYHKVVWFLTNVSYSSSLLCFFGTILSFIATPLNHQIFIDSVAVFKSSEVNFYIIAPIVTLVDMLICGSTIRLLHFVNMQQFLLIFYIFHGCRYAAGYGAQFQALDFGPNNLGLTMGFIIVSIFLVAPILHLSGFGIYRLRMKIILTMRERERRRRFFMNMRSNLLSFDYDSTTRSNTTRVSGSNVSSSGIFSPMNLDSRDCSPDKRVYWSNRIYPRHPPIYET